MGIMDDAWRQSVQKILDKRKKKVKHIVCRYCGGNGYVVVDRISPKHIRTDTCKMCGGSGNLGLIADAKKDKEG